MHRLRLFLAMSLAFSALSPSPALLRAQTLPSGKPSLLSPLEASLTAAAPDPRVSAFASLPDAPAPAGTRAGAEFAAIFAAPCSTRSGVLKGKPDVDSADNAREPCLESPNPYTRFLNTTTPVPLTPEQKAHLAFLNLKDPGNLATILYLAGFTIGTNAHTAYGPGWKGFGRNVGYSFLQDTTGEFFGTFLIPSLTHEDPHYHRMAHASIPRRTLHAISRTAIAQSDSGASMPNFSALLTYPIGAEISNLYVPGINGNGPSTVARFLTGYATDPLENLITEFLPDVAKRIHVRVIFVQRVLNPVSNDQ